MKKYRKKIIAILMALAVLLSGIQISHFGEKVVYAEPITEETTEEEQKQEDELNIEQEMDIVELPVTEEPIAEEPIADEPVSEPSIEEKDTEGLKPEVRDGEEVIIGDDNRWDVYDTKMLPFRTICLLYVTFPSGRSCWGTGTMVSKNTVLTAGHCLYNSAEGGHARAVSVWPGRKGGSVPYGRHEAKKIYVHKEYRASRSINYDYACIVLNTDVGNTTGWLSMTTTMPTGSIGSYMVSTAGYPIPDKYGQIMKGAAGIYIGVGDRRISYVMDTEEGQSGSAIRNSYDQIIGIHHEWRFRYK
jgi:V8-like Glu-specific endopeptidase